MQTSNIFEALASPPALDENSENQDPNLKTSTYTFKEKPHRPILGEITNTLPLQQVSTEPVKPAVAKPIVIENPHIAAPKDWEEIGQKTELKVNVTPDVEEKVHEYEAQFPALGETATETLKPESNFDTEILSPANIAVAQSHHDSTVDNTDNTGSLRDSINTEYILSQSAQSREVTPQNAQAHVYPEQTKTAARPVIIESTSIGPGRDWKDTAQRQLKSRIITTPQMEEKVHQYESLFPALGEQPVETPKEEEEEVFYPEEVLDPINIALAQSQVESQIESQLSMSTESLETKPVKTPQAQAKPRREIVLNPDTLLLESVEIKPQKPKEVTVYLNPDTLLLESDMPRTERPHHEPAKPMPKPVILENPSGPAKDWEGLDQSMKQSSIKETPVKEENVQVYESHFPALGEPVKASEPMTEFAPEILTSEPVAEAPKKSAAYARKFDQMLETEIEQLDQTNLNKAGDLEKKFRGQDQRLRQDWQIQGQSDLEPIEENIEIQDETEDFKATKKGTQYAKFTSRPRVRSSLEDIPEENIMNRSTELTLSAQRIDLIKEELRESEHKIVDEDPIFQAVERDLDFVKECEKTRMYGEAIRSLKRTLEALDVRFIRYQDFDIAEMNKLLYECNVQLAYCYNQIHEIRSTIDHARAALKFNPESTRAMYFLGTTLIKAGDVVGGYDVLRQMRRLSPVTKDVYRELIELELRRYERRAQEILKGLEEPDKSKDEPSPVAGIGCFVGTALSSGLFSWFLMRNSLGFSERKSWAYAIGAGTVLGGLSLMLMGHNVRK